MWTIYRCFQWNNFMGYHCSYSTRPAMWNMSSISRACWRHRLRCQGNGPVDGKNNWILVQCAWLVTSATGGEWHLFLGKNNHSLVKMMQDGLTWRLTDDWKKVESTSAEQIQLGKKLKIAKHYLCKIVIFVISLPCLKLTARLWKCMLGRLGRSNFILGWPPIFKGERFVSFWEGNT